jgi:hypothetical protein
MKYQTLLVVLSVVVAAGLGPGCSNSSNTAFLPVSTACTPQWQELASNPVITYGQSIPAMVWNDPSVMQEGTGYRMWLSGGTGQGINHVRLYQAASADGIAWLIDTAPVLGPNPVITVTTVSASSDPSSLYTMATPTDFYNNRPHFAAGGWHLWYAPADDSYYLSSAPGSTITSWKNGTPGTILDGTYSPVSNVTGTVSISSEWDSERTETPMVVKAGAIYHLYYTGGKIGAPVGQYQIGHAVSADGTTWTKDPANPVVSYQNDPAKWGYFQAAEPGVVYNGGTFYLYYVTARMRPGYAGDQALQQGIALATSFDGSNFTVFDSNHDGELDPVLVQSASYPVSSNYVGYSTPFPLVDASGKFHLFYDVAQFVAPGQWRQVALSHATGSNGFTFTEVERDIFMYNTGDWKSYEVRAPSVLQEGNEFKMWFAGNTDPANFGQPSFVIGIGYAAFGANCTK